MTQLHCNYPKASQVPQATLSLTPIKSCTHGSLLCSFSARSDQTIGFGWLYVTLWAYYAPLSRTCDKFFNFACFPKYNFCGFVRVILNNPTKGTYSLITTQFALLSLFQKLISIFLELQSILINSEKEAKQSIPSNAGEFNLICQVRELKCISFLISKCRNS